MFGLSFTHLVLLAVIMLIFIGPEQLPEVARTLARLLNEWKRTTSDIQSSLTNTLKDDLDLKRKMTEQVDKMVAPLEAPPPTPPTAAPSIEKKS